MERLSENGLKQSRANKETGLCQQSCKLIYIYMLYKYTHRMVIKHLL